MTKTTNPGWPDPTEWAQRLLERLETIGAEYLAAPWAVAADPEAFAGLNVKQACAADAILAVCNALREFPPFEKSAGVAVLHDVAGAFADVRKGGEPRLFLSSRPGTRGGDGIYRNYLKVFVVLAVRFMVEAHEMAEPKAIKLVSHAFAKAGATGRKGDPLSATTVKDWLDRAHPLASHPDDARICREVESKMTAFRADPGWPGSFDESIAWIDRVASHPLVRTKYG